MGRSESCCISHFSTPQSLSLGLFAYWFLPVFGQVCSDWGADLILPDCRASPAMGPSRAFLCILFLSGALGKGDRGTHKGRGLGQARVPELEWRGERELTDVKRNRELLRDWKAEAGGAGLPGQPRLCKTLSKGRGRAGI